MPHDYEIELADDGRWVVLDCTVEVEICDTEDEAEACVDRLEKEDEEAEQWRQLQLTGKGIGVMAIEQAFKKLLVTAITDEKFDAAKVACALSEGFDRAMLYIKGQRQIPYAERDAMMNRLVEIEALLSKWGDRDEWAPSEEE